MEGKRFFPLADGEDDVRHAVHFDHGCSLGLEPYRLRGSRRLDQGPKGRVERPSLHDKPLIVERRSLRSALRAPVETTATPQSMTQYSCGCSIVSSSLVSCGCALCRW